MRPTRTTLRPAPSAGSGKSTLAKVIIGLYLPDQGRVSWDGVDIAQVDQGELHSQVAVVLQNPAEWPMTAENNISIGRLERVDQIVVLDHGRITEQGTYDELMALGGGDAALSRRPRPESTRQPG